MQKYSVHYKLDKIILILRSIMMMCAGYVSKIF